MGLTILAWALAIVSITNCKFVVVDSDYFGPSLYYGLFKIGADGVSCTSWSDVGVTDDFGTAFTISRAFGVLTTLFTGLGWVLLLVVILIFPQKIMWNIYRVMISLAVPFQLFTFTAFAECSDLDDLGTCTVGVASIVGGINVAILLATSILSCSTPLPNAPIFKTKCCGSEGSNKEEPGAYAETAAVQSAGRKATVEETPQQSVEVPFAGDTTSGARRSSVKTSITTAPDGTRTTTREVTEADGSKTTTTTVEHV